MQEEEAGLSLSLGQRRLTGPSWLQDGIPVQGQERRRGDAVDQFPSPEPGRLEGSLPTPGRHFQLWFPLLVTGYCLELGQAASSQNPGLCLPRVLAPQLHPCPLTLLRSLKTPACFCGTYLALHFRFLLCEMKYGEESWTLGG